jgi:hypothetical protein
MSSSSFETVAFAREVRVDFDQDIEDISALFEPKWRCLLYGWWRPEVLRKPEGDSLQSLVQRVVPDSKHHPIDIFLVVHRHIRKEFEIYYSVYWGDYELQQIKVKSLRKSNGGTESIWQERIAGFGPFGVKAVTEFVEHGHLENRVHSYHDGIIEYLTGTNPVTSGT